MANVQLETLFNNALSETSLEHQTIIYKGNLLALTEALLRALVHDPLPPFEQLLGTRFTGHEAQAKHQLTFRRETWSVPALSNGKFTALQFCNHVGASVHAALRWARKRQPHGRWVLGGYTAEFGMKTQRVVESTGFSLEGNAVVLAAQQKVMSNPQADTLDMQRTRKSARTTEAIVCSMALVEISGAPYVDPNPRAKEPSTSAYYAETQQLSAMPLPLRVSRENAVRVLTAYHQVAAPEEDLYAGLGEEKALQLLRVHQSGMLTDYELAKAFGLTPTMLELVLERAQGRMQESAAEEPTKPRRGRRD